jgi:hypothetical protein
MNFTSLHTIEPYNFRLIIATPINKEEIKSLEEKWGTRNEADQLAGIYDIDHDHWKAVLVIFNLNHKQTVTYGMISHETTHIVDSIFSRIGHTYDYENNEVGAYLSEWVYTIILKHFKERNLDKELTINTEIKLNS